MSKYPWKLSTNLAIDIDQRECEECWDEEGSGFPVITSLNRNSLCYGGDKFPPSKKSTWNMRCSKACASPESSSGSVARHRRASTNGPVNIIFRNSLQMKSAHQFKQIIFPSFGLHQNLPSTCPRATVRLFALLYSTTVFPPSPWNLIDWYL